MIYSSDVRFCEFLSETFFGRMCRLDSKGGRTSQLKERLDGEAESEPKSYDFAGLTVGEKAANES